MNQLRQLKEFIRQHKEHKFINVLNLGAGVQSTTVYLMMNEGLIPKADVAVFGDTQGEPESVYKHLEWLQGINDPPIAIRTRGSLSDNLVNGLNSTGQRFISIPAFTAPDQRVRQDSFKVGITRRQCTSEYKLNVVERFIRRELVGCAPRKRLPKRLTIFQYFGISSDESARAVRIKSNLKHPWYPVFPLIELGMTRQDCIEWLAGRVPHETPRSACVFCPYKSDAEWVRLKESPKDWAEAVRIDEAIRDKASRCTEILEEESLYLHRSCVPLVQVKLNPKNGVAAFSGDCVGMCGN